MGLNCFACVVALCAMACFLLCYFLVPAALTVGYWFLLYKTTWAHGVAIASIVFFGFTLLFHLASVIVGAIALCVTGAAAILACPAIGLGGSLILITVVIFIVAVITFFFGISLMGLLTSIHLLNTGAQQCPVDGADCQLLIVLFAVCVFSNSLRLFRKSPIKKDPVDELSVDVNPENTLITPIDKSKILVTTFLFNPLAHATLSSRRPLTATTVTHYETQPIV